MFKRLKAIRIIKNLIMIIKPALDYMVSMMVHKALASMSMELRSSENQAAAAYSWMVIKDRYQVLRIKPPDFWTVSPISSLLKTQI
jgi:hypothetical protein